MRVDLNFLLRALYFTKPTTLMVIAVNPGGQDGRCKRALSWDYFLIDYVRDLLRLPLKEAMRKYLGISRESMKSEWVKIQENQASFERGNGQG